MDLYINLQKAMDTAKLVKRAVQVRGQNGKIFTRMQWVNPNDASTGHGMRTVHDEASMKEAMADGVHHHPNFHSALKEQGIHDLKDHDFHNHPAIHLPETPESHSKHMARKESGQHSVGMHTPHGHGQVPDHIEDANFKRVLHREGIHPEVADMRRAMNETDLSYHTNTSSKITSLFRSLNSHHQSALRKHTEEYIDLDDTPDHVKRLQKQALNRGDVYSQWSMLSSNPHVLSHALSLALGDKYDELKNSIKGQLTINFGDGAMEGIESEGYYASTIESYVRKNMGDEAYTSLMNDLNKMEDRDRVPFLQELADEEARDADDWGEGHWEAVSERATAENYSIGLGVLDPKPTYLAFDHNSESGIGGAEEYGDHYLSVKDPNSILKMSTATIDDSFFEYSAIPKIWDMDHVADAFLLKVASKDSFDADYKKGADYVFNRHKGAIPIEIQYHSPSIDRSKYDIHRYKD